MPIAVDTQANTYTVQGTVPEGDYYYTYSGYRCLKEKKGYCWSKCTPIPCWNRRWK
ncbi:hypothetical protein LLO_2981 [Legionella longbeachae NSW150]|uniref:Uncharacterized protein n=1 Tax=Legionella longbeachae serogroup 1 (strain NSW150) TaxID=661367 RepID=D3HLU8_LEGLN|nr:conserved hypothetical protein [Legionella longbeachae D-4968]CBJ13428.1 hypothetical protein LLO_2981 [Legionella longbeachae NSW150]